MLKPDPVPDDVVGFNGSFDIVELLLPDTKEINQLVAVRSNLARNYVIEKIEERIWAKKQIPKNEEISKLKDKPIDEKASDNSESEMILMAISVFFKSCQMNRLKN